MKTALAFLLVALGTALSCTRQENLVPATTTADTGSFRMEGRVVSCQATATSGYILSSVDSLVSVSVQLEDTADATSGDLRFLALDFQRPGNQPNAPYQLALAMYCAS
ncbi:hypothetical protein [Hymenobacter coccineus]|uniref:Lipoprotein n=1 Tax=Hymenobacter coccineus TaxID=1908235 RepID=A0A1G1TK63_9BACT|nr:hypothetical protein [Hymenobacter coccineus]OGX91266.1 hypothetical protein BEN49_20435 [Hymenobacter coccineus]